MKWFVFIILILSVFSFVAAEESICIDFDAPIKISNFTAEEINGVISFNWDIPFDSPDCSGIDYYKIYRDDILIADIDENNFSENLSFGTYVYDISSIDLAGHESEKLRQMIIVFFEDDETAPTSRGGGGGGTTWTCYNWTECENNSQARDCVGKYDKDRQKTEVRECFPDYEPITNPPETVFDKIAADVEKEREELLETDTAPRGLLAITGNAVADIGDFAASTPGSISIGFIALIAFGFIFIQRKKKNK